MATKGSHWRASVYAADDATWSKWAGSEALELWQLVALHSNVDPDSLGIGSRGACNTLASVTFFDNMPVHPPIEIDHDDPLHRLLKNLERASQSFGVDGLKRYVERYQQDDAARPSDPWQTRVAVADFHAWSIRVQLPLIDGWGPRRNATAYSDAQRWPWGSHETELLRHFADIAEHWRLKPEGGPYDPEDESTAPKKEVIEPLLQAQGISEKVRQAMFTILRPDGIKPGPRRRRPAAK